MSVESDLALDIRQALAAVGQVESAIAAATSAVLVVDTSAVAPAVTAAVDAADTNVVVTGDASELTGDVTSAVDAGDSDVIVTGDASELTGDVTSAVDAGDSDVIVTGDASEVTGEITGAVDAADTQVLVTGDASGIVGAIEASVGAADTSVSINVDESGLSEATQSVDALDAGLLAAVGTSGRLRTAIAAIGFAAAAGGLFQLVDAASEAEQSVGAVSAIFGEASGTISSFADVSAESAGLTATAARNMTSQIGALLQGFGFTREEAAETSVVLAQLGADLAATFGGTPEDAVLALGAALRGEFDPLERFGVSLNVTQANLRAVELGLADSTGNVDLNARAQASLSLIMERSASAQGQFGRELNTTAGQLAVAKAAAQEAAVAVGATLAPAFVELLGVVTDDLLPTLADLGTTLGPALGSAVSAAVPVLSGAVSVLTSLTPVVEALAAVLDAIPDPVLQIVGTFLALRAATGPLGSVLDVAVRSLGGLGPALALNTSSLGLFRGSLATARDGVSTLASSVSPLTLALSAAAIGFTIYAQAQANARREAAELEAQSDSLREALNSQEGAVSGLEALFEDLINKGEDLQLQFLNLELPADEVFQTAGISASEFAEALADTDQPIRQLIDSLREGSDTMGGLDADAKELAAQSLAELQLQAVATAGAMIEAGIATERWSTANVNAAFEANTARDGSINLVGALDQLVTEEREAEEAAQAHADALTEQEEALQAIAVSAPAVTFLMAALGDESNRTSDTLGALALAATEAGLSEDELQAVLVQLGATGPEAVAQLQAVADTITRVRDAGLQTLPSIEDLAGEFDEFSLSGFRDDLAKGLEAIQNFNSNLVLIAEQGGPRLAAAASQLGPQFAAEIANGIKNGSPGVADQVELLLAAIEGAGADTSDILSTQIGPDLAVASGQMGTLATSAFGENFRLDASGQIVQLESTIIGGRPGVRTRAQELGVDGTGGFGDGLDLSSPATSAVADLDSTIANSGPGVRTRTQELGTSATSGFQEGFTPATPAQTRTNEARIRIQNAKEGMRGAGSSTGQAGTSGFSAGVAGFGEAGRVAVVQAINTILRLRDLARSGGSQVGSALGAGVVAGIAGQVANVQAAAANAVLAAVRAAKAAAKIDSPSKVFAEIGRDLSDGVVLGLKQGEDDVANAAASLIGTGAAATADALSVDVRRFDTGTAGPGMVLVQGVEGMFQVILPPGFDPAQAPQTGANIARSFVGFVQSQQVRAIARTQA